MWKYTFEAPVRTRILRSRFFGVITWCDDGLWFERKSNKWYKMEDTPNEGYISNVARCSSFKAFKRHLRKHPKLKSQQEVVLRSRYVGYDIVAKWEE